MSSAVAPSAIGQLYADHHHWLVRWLQARTRCPHWALDVSQETFCRLIEKGLPSPLRDARSYLAVVARRLLVDDIRRRDLEQALADAAALLGGHVEELTPDRIVEAVQMLEGLMALLAGLPADVREAFLLRRVDRLGHAEIAARLGISDRTVKRHVARAYTLCYVLAFGED
ncbi:sigma-70 family RNA polymerase sigma factor [Sphingobium sp. WCS2017Hpa-17]|uniref:sigma-70 family RNA polymerase sigma factor n=1 Tax=Sphingobium sp. WCS2017Hpa-17 TaxID=3073638 RepID=UPI00288B5D2B|nr:sigma-70 family RNA polymerase sigma factor [Sphingobium sp. WCS2017Hpa-17]